MRCLFKLTCSIQVASLGALGRGTPLFQAVIPPFSTNILIIKASVLDFLNNLRGLGIEYRNRVVVPACQAAYAGGIDSLKSIFGLHTSLNSGSD